MEQFYEYIENSIPGQDNEYSYKFKKKALEKMNERANELSARGLRDQKVLNDLILDENKNLANEYKQYYEGKMKQKRSRRFAIANVIGSVIYLLTLVVAFLGISFSTQEWSITWVLIVDGVLLWAAYILMLIIGKITTMKKIFSYIARVLLALVIMIISVAVFIFMLAVMHIHMSWLAIIGGVLGIFLADGFFATVTKQKLAILNWILYIPAIATMLFIIVCALGILKWSVGWIMIPLSLILDLMIIAAAINKNTKIEQEVIDAWKEN